jgi:hypothetical protein
MSLKDFNSRNNINQSIIKHFHLNHFQVAQQLLKVSSKYNKFISFVF